MEPDRPGPTASSSVVEIRTTMADRSAAETLARRLIEMRLAACVQLDGPITSIYRWKEGVETATEHGLTVKTSQARAEACTAAIQAMHGYDLPEILATETVATPAYAAWVHENTSP